MEKETHKSQNENMDYKYHNKVKLEEEAKVRFVNFMVEMIKKYGSEIVTKNDSSTSGV